MTLLLFKRCEIKKFPFDCFEVLNELGIGYKKYSELSAKKQAACYKCSDSAFRLDLDIYYNDIETPQRIKFSLMHELGHIMLGHTEHSEQNEHEANFFSKNMLAPPITIHYAKTGGIKDVATLFDITPSFADNAIKYYEKWHMVTIKCGMSKLDKGFYSHFYNDELKRFVFNERYCKFCGDPIVNKIEPVCSSCETNFLIRRQRETEENKAVNMLRNNWLYGDS
jgi:hypothetical protein